MEYDRESCAEQLKKYLNIWYLPMEPDKTFICLEELLEIPMEEFGCICGIMPGLSEIASSDE